VGTGFRKRSCSNNKLERDGDSKKSHLALEPWRPIMRAVPFVVGVLALAAIASCAHAQTPPARHLTIEVAWPAPVGHFQPRAGDIPIGIELLPSRTDQESQDREIDQKLQICRGC
jgi:hypothetical protein